MKRHGSERSQLTSRECRISRGFSLFLEIFAAKIPRPHHDAKTENCAIAELKHRDVTHYVKSTCKNSVCKLSAIGFIPVER